MGLPHLISQESSQNASKRNSKKKGMLLQVLIFCSKVLFSTKCVYTSEQFPDEKFEANFWHITVMRPAGREEGGWPWGFLLMFAGLACMLSMCFGWNKPEPVKSDEEAPMLK